MLVQKVVTLQMKFCKNYRTLSTVTEFFRPNWPKIRRRGWQHCPVVLLIYIRTCLLVKEGGGGWHHTEPTVVGVIHYCGL
jgi:hypothetical protein